MSARADGGQACFSNRLRQRYDQMLVYAGCRVRAEHDGRKEQATIFR